MGSIFCCDEDTETSQTTQTKDYNNNNQTICQQIEHDINCCVKPDDDTKIDKQKLLDLIESNEETQIFTFNYIKKLAESNTNKFSIDGDEKKSERKKGAILPFDNTTLEKRLPNFNKLVYTPSNVFELIDNIQESVNKGISVKAMGSRYAMTEVTFTNGLLIDMFNGLNDPNMRIDVVSLNEYGKEIYNNRNMHLCQSGASISAISDSLWPPNDRRSLINKETNLTYKTLREVPGYALCIGGVVNSGSAGEGTPFYSKDKRNRGSLINSILAYSMIIIDDNNKVQMVQIEPSIENGSIHNSNEWKKQFPDIELIQNDNIFEAGLVSMGLLGVVYSYYILLDDAAFFEENTRLISYKQFKESEWDNITNKILNDEIGGIELLLSPYISHGMFSKKEFKDSPPMIVQTFEKTDEIPQDSGKDFTETPPVIVRTAAIINNWITRILPEITPFIMKMTLKLVDSADNIIKPSISLGSLGNASAIPTITAAYAITYDKNIFFNFLDDYITLLNAIRKNDRNQVNPLPLSIRFSSYKSKGLLNMFNNDNINNDTYGYFWFEFVVPNFVKEFDENVTATIENVYGIINKLQELSMNKPYFGNPHWGLYFDTNKNIFQNINKDKLNAFVDIYKKYNKTKTFSNKFSKESGLDDMAGL